MHGDSGRPGVHVSVYFLFITVEGRQSWFILLAQKTSKWRQQQLWQPPIPSVPAIPHSPQSEQLHVHKPSARRTSTAHQNSCQNLTITSHQTWTTSSLRMLQEKAVLLGVANPPPLRARGESRSYQTRGRRVQEVVRKVRRQLLYQGWLKLLQSLRPSQDHSSPQL